MNEHAYIKVILTSFFLLLKFCYYRVSRLMRTYLPCCWQRYYIYFILKVYFLNLLFVLYCSCLISKRITLHNQSAACVTVTTLANFHRNVLQTRLIINEFWTVKGDAVHFYRVNYWKEKDIKRLSAVLRKWFANVPEGHDNHTDYYRLSSDMVLKCQWNNRFVMNTVK